MSKIDHHPKDINAQIRRYYKKFLNNGVYLHNAQLDIKIGSEQFIAVNMNIINAGKRLYEFFINNGMLHWGGHTYKTQLQDGTILIFPVSDFRTYQSAYIGNMRSQFRKM